MKKYHLNIEKLKSKICFQTETIDDYAELVLQRDIDEYNRCEKNKREVKQWINTFNDCTNYDELKVVCKEYEKTALSQNLLIYFFFYQYAYCNQYSKSKMRILMKYLSDDCYIDFNTVQGLCFIFDPKDVIAEYNYSQGTEVTNAKHKKQLKEFVKDIYYRNLLGGLYRENPVKSRNYEAVKSSKKWENVGNSYIIPALLLYRYSYI